MSSVLIIDDEPQILRMLRIVLEDAGYKVLDAGSGREGLVSAASHLPDAIILDLGLPDLPGIEVLRRLREWNEAPVLILSAKDSGEDKVEALDSGADDYVTKPFDTQELMARLRVLMRRNHAPDEPVFESGMLVIDFANRNVLVAGKEILFTATEYSLLRELARHAGKVVTHKHLLTSVWGPNASEHSQYLRVYMSHIRKKLTEAGMDAGAIRTETGIGYRLTEDAG